MAKNVVIPAWRAEMEKMLDSAPLGQQVVSAAVVTTILKLRAVIKTQTALANEQFNSSIRALNTKLGKLEDAVLVLLKAGKPVDSAAPANLSLGTKEKNKSWSAASVESLADYLRKIHADIPDYQTLEELAIANGWIGGLSLELVVVEKTTPKMITPTPIVRVFRQGKLE